MPSVSLPARYDVRRVARSPAVETRWDGDFWGEVSPLELRRFMGARPTHFPRTEAKLVADDASLHVIFLVRDRYVRAVAQRHQDAVCQDSCVEFFFTPGEDAALGYFNLEMNCGGTMLLHYQRVPRRDPTPIAAEDLARIETAVEMPRIVDPEIAEPTAWSVAYRLPLELIRKYFPSNIDEPVPGAVWRANFYKCADASSHPHWLTWSPVDFPKPDFHRPEGFGKLVFG